MTESEAISVLEQQCVGDGGFVARLRRGEGLQREGVIQAQEALDTLAALWESSTDLPKVVARPLVDVSTPILESIPLYPDLENELWRLESDFSGRLDELCSTTPSRMSQEQAEALVYGHLLGLPSVSLKFHHHEALDDVWVSELRSALDVLTVAWAAREIVPKAIVRPMLEARGLIRGHAAVYPDQQSNLEQIADDLAERIKHCLS